MICISRIHTTVIVSLNIEFSDQVSFWSGTSKVLARKKVMTIGFESHQGFWILSCDEAIQLAYWTMLVLLRCLLVPETRNEGPVKAEKSPYDLTWTVSARLKTQRNKREGNTWPKMVLNADKMAATGFNFAEKSK